MTDIQTSHIDIDVDLIINEDDTKQLSKIEVTMDKVGKPNWTSTYIDGASALIIAVVDNVCSKYEGRVSRDSVAEEVFEILKKKINRIEEVDEQ